MEAYYVTYPQPGVLCVFTLDLSHQILHTHELTLIESKETCIVPPCLLYQDT